MEIGASSTQQRTDLKAVQVTSWLQAFQDFHTQAIANHLNQTENTSRLGLFLKGQFYEHGLFGFEKNPDKALPFYKRGSMLSDPLACYRIAEACSHPENPLKIPSNFEENVYYQSMTISFMNLYYGTQIFDCLSWFENYLGIDPEQTTLRRILNQKIPERTVYANEFANTYQVTNIVSKFIGMHSPSRQITEEELNIEKTRVQTIYEEAIEILTQIIQNRAQDPTKTSCLAYDWLLYLFCTEALNSNKNIDTVLHTLSSYPNYLLATTQSLCQELEIMLLLERDNGFFAHMRFVLIEIHNILQVIMINQPGNLPQTTETKQIALLLEATFLKIFYKRFTSQPAQQVSDIVFILRHYSEIASDQGTREEIEKAINIQEQELYLPQDVSNEEQFAYCYYKLASLRRRLMKNRNIHVQTEGAKGYSLNGQSKTEQEYYQLTEQAMKTNFDKAESLYESRTKNMNELPLAKFLGTFFLGRIHEKYKSTENVAQRYYFKVSQMHQQQSQLFNNCRTFQFEIIFLKALKRLNRFQKQDPNFALSNYFTLSNTIPSQQQQQQQSLQQSQLPGQKPTEENNGCASQFNNNNGTLNNNNNSAIQNAPQNLSASKIGEALISSQQLQNSILQGAKMTSPSKPNQKSTTNETGIINNNNNSTIIAQQLIQGSTGVNGAIRDTSNINNTNNPQLKSFQTQTSVFQPSNNYNTFPAVPLTITDPAQINNNQHSIIPTSNTGLTGTQQQGDLQQSILQKSQQQQPLHSVLRGQEQPNNQNNNGTILPGNNLDSSQLKQVSWMIDQQAQQQLQYQQAHQNENHTIPATSLIASKFFNQWYSSAETHEVPQVAARDIKLKGLIRKCPIGSVQKIQFSEELYMARLIEFVPKTFYDRLKKELDQARTITQSGLLPVLSVCKWHSSREKRAQNDPLNILLISDMKQTTLESLIRENLILSDQVAFRIAKTIVQAIVALHENGLAHTNLRLDNILVDSAFNAVITDWIVDRLIVQQVDAGIDEWAPSLAFAPPEIIESQQIQAMKRSATIEASVKPQLQQQVTSKETKKEQAVVLEASNRQSIIEQSKVSNNGIGKDLAVSQGFKENTKEGLGKSVNQMNGSQNVHLENSVLKNSGTFPDETALRSQRASLLSAEADVWSLGVIFLCLFFDFFPSDRSISDVCLYGGLQLNNFNPHLTRMHQLVIDMLQITPQDRISSKDVLKQLEAMEVQFSQ